MFFKVLGSPETLFQKGFWWGAGATPLRTRLPYKSKFDNLIILTILSGNIFIFL